jgi:hypothetical protein
LADVKDALYHFRVDAIVRTNIGCIWTIIATSPHQPGSKNRGSTHFRPARNRKTAVRGKRCTTAEQTTAAAEKAAEAEIKASNERQLVSYTGDQVLVGLVQFFVFILQLIAFAVQAVYMRRSAAEMRKTTEAAEKVSRDQIAHSHQIERAYISGGGAPEVNLVDLGTETTPGAMGGGKTVSLGIAKIPTGSFTLCVNGYGKTPGELWRIGIGFCEADNVPSEPDYRVFDHHDWFGPGTMGRPIHRLAIPKMKNPAIYGRFFYRDIFGGNHSSGFINELGTNRNESIPLLAPAAYTAERDEN